jgi:hypothetical protein
VNQIVLYVWRLLYNRLEGLSDDSPRGFDLHDRRKRALQEVLDNDVAWDVRDWGLTDDRQRTHEFVELLLQLKPIDMEIVENISDYPSLSNALIQSGLGAAMAEAVTALIARLHLQQVEEKISNFDIQVPDGPLIRCLPIQQGTTPIMVALPNRQPVWVDYRET